MSVNNLIIESIKKILNENDIVILCIDGPTAAGKTILAEEIGNLLIKNLFVNVDYFRLDWTLSERTLRENDLKDLMQHKDPFYYEGELHMQLNKFKQFLEDIHLIKKNKDFRNNNLLKLKDLYSREQKGQCIGRYTYNFSSPKNVIICEGHYTSRSEFRNLIDLNICLLATKEELLKRKIERVKGYRSPQAAIDYFFKIDIPSFRYHLARFYSNIDIFVDNTNYYKPRLLPDGNFEDWLKTDFDEFKIEQTKKFNYKKKCKEIYNVIFSSSKRVEFLNFDEFERIFKFHNFLDQIIENKLKNKINIEEKNLEEIIENELLNIFKGLKNKNNDKKNIEIASSSSLYDVYQRKIPVSIGINMNNRDRGLGINYHITIDYNEIFLFWDGGVFGIKIIRSLNDLEKDKSDSSIVFKNYSLKKCISKNKLNNLKVIYTPTDFCTPSFMRGEDFNIVYTGREHQFTSIFSICKKVIQNPESIFSHRFSLYSELNFYKRIFELSGVHCVTISNYIIGINTNDHDLRDNFKIWSKNWLLLEIDQKTNEEKYDLEIKKEIKSARNFVVNNCPSFTMIDSFLFEKQVHQKVDSLILDLEKMLQSNIRLVRKRAFEYILNDQKGIQLSTNDLLLANGIKSEKSIKKFFPLSMLPSLYPTIMAEVYLWLHIRGDSSAILGANVYDIDGSESLDIQGLLETSSDLLCPIVIQSSFNALGQSENFGKKIYRGYLDLKDGPLALVNSCIQSNFKNILIKGSSRSFYGIGIDHIDAKNDFPKGRAKRFLSAALGTGNITHLVLDGSYLFKAKNRDHNTIKNAYKKVSDFSISLIDLDQSIFLKDLEYCVGELNYIENEKISMIPDSEEIRLFTSLIRKGLADKNKGHFNCRPTLFIGNVGTTHHSGDKEYVDSSITIDWVENVKNQNFISAVLHGTTNSESTILNKSTSGCHKVNVAGDFLKIYQSSLPNSLPKYLREFNPSSKFHIKEIRRLKSNLNLLEKNKIIMNIKNKTNNIIKTINSPSFTNKDFDYFHRSSYFFNNLITKLILSEFKKSKESFREKNIRVKNFKNLNFSASMIEVPFQDGFLEIASELINKGLRYFHIDVGDGNLISRKFSGIKKLDYLLSISDDLKIHTHLMVQDPLALLPNNKSYIDNYIDSGSTSLALHTRSFPNDKLLKETIDYIRVKGCRPGIIIEINQIDFQKIWKVIKFLKIDWVVIMGVPIGYGGQLFQSQCLQKINFLREMSIKENIPYFDIEVDGGLNFNNINDCLNAGANIFAGWSIIKDRNLEKIIQNYMKLNKQLIQ